MRVATAGAFALGFACGVLTLGIVVGARPSVRAEKLPPFTVAAPGAPPLPPPLPPPDADRLAIDPAAPLHLRMPLDGVRPDQLSETFYDKRGGTRQHEALDIPAPRGTPVRAVAEGNVVKLFLSKQGGNTVYQFDNSETYCFYYAHLDRYAQGLKEGTLLRAGDILGYVGTTGNAPPNVPHLHLAVFRLKADKKWWEGTPIDPLPLLK